jgi:hypothetical protein
MVLLDQAANAGMDGACNQRMLAATFILDFVEFCDCRAANSLITTCLFTAAPQPASAAAPGPNVRSSLQKEIIKKTGSGLECKVTTLPDGMDRRTIDIHDHQCD